MAHVAHDASGPASPKPGDIAPQQASRPDSADRGKLRVFISYSRDDLDFADQLNAALDACGFECFIDRQSGGEDWKRRLGDGTSVGKSLHRIEESALRREVEAAGFKLVAAGDFWRHPADARDFSIQPPSGKAVDEFVLKFQKPM